MRIGGGVTDTHRAGASALWHDADYEADRSFHIPTVEKNLDGLPLPSERPQVPDGYDDPFKLQEQAYDAAAMAMERGIKGMEFLHGKPPPTALGAAGKHDDKLAAEEATRTMMHMGGAPDPNAPTRVMATQEARAESNQIEKREQAGKAPPKVSETTTGAQPGDGSQRAFQMAESLAVAAVGMAAGQAIDPASLTGAAAAEAASMVKAAGMTKLTVSMVNESGEIPDEVRRAQRETAADNARGGRRRNVDPEEW